MRSALQGRPLLAAAQNRLLGGRVFGAILVADRPMIWNVPIDLKAGANALTLDQRNARARRKGGVRQATKTGTFLGI